MRMTELINCICNMIRAMYPIMKDLYIHTTARKKKPDQSGNSDRENTSA